MSIRIYHKNLKLLTQNKFTPEDGGDIEYYKNIGARLIMTGLRKNNNLKKQIKYYKDFVKLIQSQKIYKIKSEDQDNYVCCVLALWKLGIYDPDDATSPIYVAPKRKSSQRKGLLQKEEQN